MNYYEKYLKYKNKYLDLKKVYKGGDDDTLKILSWNICWGCMAADHTSKKDGTAYDLALECEKINKNNAHVCLNNVKDLLNAEAYDFIGLQEATNWKMLTNGTKLSNMGYVHHETKFKKETSSADLITFYNLVNYNQIIYLID